MKHPKEDQVVPASVQLDPDDDDVVPTAIPIGQADDFSYRHLRFIVPPTAPWRSKWDMAIVVALFYTATVTVFEVAFLTVSINAIFIINRFIDVLFISDLILTFMTPFIDENTLLWVVDHKLIAVRYVTKPPFWFFIDGLTCIPFDAIAYAIQQSDPSSDSGNLHALRILRLLRLVRVARILRGLQIVKKYEVETGIKNSTRTLVFFAFLMVLLSHWVSCFFVLVTQLESRTPVEYAQYYEDNNNTAPDLYGWNWIVNYFQAELGWSEDEYGMWSIYLAGFYYSVMTLTTIGYGDVVPRTDAERIYTIIIMFLGGAVYAYAVGSVCSIVANMDPLRNDFKNDMDDMNDYMVASKLPRELRDRLRRYMHFAYEKRRVEHQRQLLDELSPGLTEEVADFLNSQWVRKVPFMRVEVVPDLAAFTAGLATKLSMQAHSPMETLLRPGIEVQEMFIVDRGAVLIHDVPDATSTAPTMLHGQIYVRETLDKVVVKELAGGSCFGHEAMIEPGFRSPYFATTLTFSNIYHVSKEDFAQVLELYPRTAAKLAEYAKEMGYGAYSANEVTAAPQLGAHNVQGMAAMHLSPAEQELLELKGELATLVTRIKAKDEELRILAAERA